MNTLDTYLAEVEEFLFIGKTDAEDLRIRAIRLLAIVKVLRGALGASAECNCDERVGWSETEQKYVSIKEICSLCSALAEANRLASEGK